MITRTKYKMLKEILEHPGIKISELIKKVRASQKSVYAYINEFIVNGVVKEQRTGILRTFTPNLKSEPGKLYFSLIELQKKLDFLKRHPPFKGAIAQFENETKNIIDFAVIFGSFARGTETKTSDVDVLVAGERLRMPKIERITEKCLITLPNRASVRIVKTDEFLRGVKSKDEFAVQIIKDHVVIVNVQKWVELLSQAL